MNSSKTILWTVALTLSFTCGCVRSPDNSSDVSLKGYSMRNYVELNRNIDRGVCIRGRLSSDTLGTYFQLQPRERDGIITIGVSRIILDLGDDDVQLNRVVNGRQYRVCGILRDATPFRECSHDRCRWYRLEAAELQ